MFEDIPMWHNMSEPLRRPSAHHLEHFIFRIHSDRLRLEVDFSLRLLTVTLLLQEAEFRVGAFLLLAFGACNYSAFVLQRRSGASAARLLMPAVALLCTTSVLVCAFVQDTDVRKASTTSCVVLVVLVCCSFRISDQKQQKLQQPTATEKAKKLE